MASRPDHEVVRTRFAPSPSGHLHVGGARTALYCWAYAKGRGGKFILRIEDTDQKRTSDAAAMGFLDDLKWLGIEWDEGPEFDGCGGGDAGPYHQSERLDIYDRYIAQLISEGKAYRAFETAEELEKARQEARAEKRNYRYDGASQNLDADTIRQYIADGRPHVVRIKTPREEIVFHDEVRGEMTSAPDQLDHFVIRKTDGFPTYHFAVVVDDELMGVTHVIRAEEHLSNTFKHLVLQQALGFRRPVYAHLSVMTNLDGSKMSKRDKDRALRKAVEAAALEAPPDDAIARDRWDWWLIAEDRQLELDEAEALAQALDVVLPEINIDDFRPSGYLPEVLMNYLALLGWNPGENIEKFDRAFLVKTFDFDRVIKSPAKFDREKLLAFNLDAAHAMSPDEFVDRMREHARQYHPEFIENLGDDRFEKFARANQSRSKTLEDAFRSDRFFIMRDDEIEYDVSKSTCKALTGGEPNGFTHLEIMRRALESLDEWTADSIEQAVREYADAHTEGKLGKVAQPLRIAVTGGTISPAIFDTLAILGKRSTLARIDRCLAQRDVIYSLG